MTLAGFKSNNHPQQTAKRGAKDEVDDRGTDPEFFAKLSERFGGFTLDVAASDENAKVPAGYFTREENGLERKWVRADGGRARVWCNPPYSDCGAWVRKAWREFGYHDLGVEVNGGQGLRTANTPGDADEASDEPKGASADIRVRYAPASTPSLIVMLLPANRVEQKWWQELVEPYRDRPGSPLRVEFLPGRMRFIRPNWTPGPKGDRPPFGCCLLIWEDR